MSEIATTLTDEQLAKTISLLRNKSNATIIAGTVSQDAATWTAREEGQNQFFSVSLSGGERIVGYSNEAAWRKCLSRLQEGDYIICSAQRVSVNAYTGSSGQEQEYPQFSKVEILAISVGEGVEVMSELADRPEAKPRTPRAKPQTVISDDNIINNIVTDGAPVESAFAKAQREKNEQA